MICDTCNKINRACLPENKEEKIIKEFCKKIPKEDGMENSLIEKKNEYINWFANNFQEQNDNKEPGVLDEKELKNALQNEMKVFRYLMSKHKNSRALVFYNNIFVPTYNTLSEKLMATLGDNYQEDEKKDTYNKTDANNKRVQQQKNFFDSIQKSKSAFDGRRETVLKNFKTAFDKEGNRRNKYLQDLCDGAELIKYAIDNHRHQRGINFTYVYEEIINDTINKVNARKGAQK